MSKLLIGFCILIALDVVTLLVAWPIEPKKTQQRSPVCASLLCFIFVPQMATTIPIMIPTNAPPRVKSCMFAAIFDAHILSRVSNNLAHRVWHSLKFSSNG